MTDKKGGKKETPGATEGCNQAIQMARGSDPIGWEKRTRGEVKKKKKNEK